MHREFPPVAFVCAALLLVPLPWHWRAGNVATMAMIFWLFITNIIYGVDAIVWGDNVNVVIPVWCDITTKIIIGSNFALPAACLCICVHLEQVASVRQARTLSTDKRRRQMVEGLVCFGLPLLFMALHTIVQGHLYDIIEEYGCRPTTYVSIPAIFIIWIPPLVMAIGSLIFAGLALRHFLHRRVSFALHLNASQSALTTSRYIRLMAMSAVQMIWSLVATSYTLWFTLTNVPLRPWLSWNFVHSDFNRADIYPTVFTPQPILTTYYILWWMLPASSLIFIVFFIFGKDAMDEYKACFAWIKKHVFRMSTAAKPQGSSLFVKLAGSTPNMSSNSTFSTMPPYGLSSQKHGTRSSGFDRNSKSSASEASVIISEIMNIDYFPGTPSISESHSSPASCTNSTSSMPAPLLPAPGARVSRHAVSSPTSRPFTYPSMNAPHNA